jgi:hypothetical protein
MEDDAHERFVDAVLHEQARLGNKRCDDKLVEGILSRTLLPKTAVEVSSLPTARSVGRERRLWITSGIAAAVSLTLVALWLSRLPYQSGSTSETGMLFSVRLLPPEGTAGTNEEKHSSPIVAANPHHKAVSTRRPPSSATSTLEAPETILEITTSFEPSFTSFPEQSLRRELFRISSEREKSSGTKYIYSGGVKISNAEFLVEASVAEVSTNESSSSSATPYFVAYDVVLTQHHPWRQARAHMMTFDPSDSSFVLTGVRQLNTSEGKLRRFTSDARVIITSTSLAIEASDINGRANEVKYADPLPQLPK